MCSSYTLKSNWPQIQNKLTGYFLPSLYRAPNFRNLTGKENWDETFQGFLKTNQAPVIYFKEGELVLEDFCFSLCPSWSKEFPCKWSTYNARMDRPSEKPNQANQKIFEIPSWREAFSKGQVCLVPMTSAIESSYFGMHAGEMVEFSVRNEDLFFACGIWSRWQNKTESHQGFALITDDPYPYFYNAGHDRSLMLIQSDFWPDWLMKTYSSPERYQFLKEKRVDADFTSRSFKKMKAGWEKRAPSPEDIKRIKVFNS